MDIDLSDLEPIEPAPEPIKILVSAAHHDDIEFGVAGSVAKWVKEGAEVTYVIITDGGSGSNEPGVIRTELADRRREEQLKAAAAIGVNDVRFLGYQDGYLQPTMELRRELTRIIREVQPHRVVCQDPTTVFASSFYVNHPDHRAAGEATLYATFPSAETRPIFPELLEEGLEPHKVKELFVTLSTEPTHFVDISETFEDKLKSLSYHVSQLGEGEDLENNAFKWIRKWNAETGEKVGVQYAETYRVLKFDRNGDDESDGGAL